MGGESTIRTAPRAGASKGPAGGRTGQVLSGLAVALGLVLFLGGFVWGAIVYRPYTVPTRSMAPTIDAGARVLAQRIGSGDIHRGDVVVFTDKTWVSNAPVVKRDDGLAELQDFPSVKVPEGRLFLLGDERSGSLDSTAHLTDAARGTVARSAVSARVEAVVWPMYGMLEQATGYSAQQWMAFQAEYDLERARAAGGPAAAKDRSPVAVGRADRRARFAFKP